MIVTDLKNAFEQIPQHAGLRKGLEFLQQSAGKELADGRIEIDGSAVYALVQSYDSIPTDAAKYEAHRKYIDIQYIVSGSEMIGWTQINKLAVTVPYSESKDIWFGSVPASETTPVLLSAGQLAILFPDDAHAPKIAPASPAPVKKIVVKVAL